ncbi:TadE/TadG family type IV pilus assembly protein [Brevundimonas aveniformis]|uniref:TadE/TadG family type IV pilus assembly protein n=1 Tax=Brevundimonas aveniformis TaxID=370977 RepID=UPI000409B048|nr:TadE/TadG family type IV pilus assembly protein [Brevundimonas aveniformis]
MILRRGFWKARQGSVAIEFALIATVFIFMLLGVLQFALFFLSRVIIHDTLSDLATGDGLALVQAANRTGTRNYICDRLIFSPSCRSNLRLELRSLGSASASGMSTTFATGGSETLMVLRAEAPIVVFIPFISSLNVRGKALFLQP